MKKLALTAAALTALTLVLGASSAFAVPDRTTPVDLGEPKKCGDSGETGFSWYDLVAYNTACRNARKAVDAFVFEGTRDPFAWRCKSRNTGYESLTGKCKRTHKGLPQKLVFNYGS